MSVVESVLCKILGLDTMGAFSINEYDSQLCWYCVITVT